jgi:hypothetical protein
MELDPGIHIVMHSVLFLKPGVKTGCDSQRAHAIYASRVRCRIRCVSEQGFKTPVANITRVIAILERSNDPNVRQALRYTRRAWIQLDQQNPVSTVREERVGESRS